MVSLPKNTVSLGQVMPQVKEQLTTGKRVMLSFNGISMRPLLEPKRDMVELSALPDKLKKYDLPLYQREDGQYVMHRIVKVDEAYGCMGDRQFELEYPVRHDQIIAVVTAFVRKGKRYSVEDWRYKLYCRIWAVTRPVRWLFRSGKAWLKLRFNRLFGTGKP